jgi:hypothetical protein
VSRGNYDRIPDIDFTAAKLYLKGSPTPIFHTEGQCSYDLKSIPGVTYAFSKGKVQYERFVMIVDGDKAKCAAAKILFPFVLLLMCVYHGTECFKRKFGPICRSIPKTLYSLIPPAAQQDSFTEEESFDMWIACDGCNKWCLLDVSFDITQFTNRSFHCADVNLNCCDPSCSTFEREVVHCVN